MEKNIANETNIAVTDNLLSKLMMQSIKPTKVRINADLEKIKKIDIAIIKILYALIRLIFFDNSKIKNGNKSARYIAKVLLFEYDSVSKL